MISVFKRIQLFNQGRIPSLLQLKYQHMRADIFSFFRGTCHLFYEDWPTNIPLNEAPSVWVCGDLHLQNFGSYKGDNRLVYFDINDFDEACLAPCTWDLARFLTSVLVGAPILGITDSDALTLCHSFISAYTKNLANGQIRTVERETATGMVKNLLMGLKQRDRKTFLDERTKLTKGKRKLRIDNARTQSVTNAERKKITNLIETWSSKQADPNFFKLLDVAHRIAGTGSLGLERYVLLIEGKDSPNQNYLLDLKAEPVSSLQPYLHLPQPQWVDQATRVIAIQKRVQGTPPALLADLQLQDQSYILHELQPTQDRVNLNQQKGALRRLEKVIRTMGEVTAWGQLRSSGRQGSAIADELITFAQAAQWQKPLLDYARDYSKQVEEDYRMFCSAFDQTSH